MDVNMYVHSNYRIYGYFNVIFSLTTGFCCWWFYFTTMCSGAGDIPKVLTFATKPQHPGKIVSYSYFCRFGKNKS